MRVAYVTTYDAADIRNWSGIGLHMAGALEKQGIQVERVGPLNDKSPLHLTVQKVIYRVRGKKYLKERSPARAKDYARQVSQKLARLNADVVLSAGTIPIAHLESKQPIVFWTDATFAGMIDFYSDFTNLCTKTIREGNELERTALQRCRMAIYSSPWAAESAVKHYGANPNKIAVVPFGANVECQRTTLDIERIIGAKQERACFLLFLGVDWIRKGGPMALRVAEILHRKGWTVELRVVGCSPPLNPMPCFVKSYGFISKSTEEGQRQLERLLQTSHFLILPSIAECTPIAFSEAASFGLPCITSDVGGIPGVIRDDVNGRMFPLAAQPEDYGAYIESHLTEASRYRKFALSSFSEFQTRLNWNVAGEKVKNLLSCCT